MQCAALETWYTAILLKFPLVSEDRDVWLNGTGIETILPMTGNSGAMPFDEVIARTYYPPYVKIPLS